MSPLLVASAGIKFTALGAELTRFSSKGSGYVVHVRCAVDDVMTVSSGEDAGAAQKRDTKARSYPRDLFSQSFCRRKVEIALDYHTRYYTFFHIFLHVYHVPKAGNCQPPRTWKVELDVARCPSENF